MSQVHSTEAIKAISVKVEAPKREIRNGTWRIDRIALKDLEF